MMPDEMPLRVTVKATVLKDQDQASGLWWEPSEHGPFVFWTHHIDALAAKNARIAELEAALQAEKEGKENALGAAHCVIASKTEMNIALRAENKRLREALEEVRQVAEKFIKGEPDRISYEADLRGLGEALAAAGNNPETAKPQP